VSADPDFPRYHDCLLRPDALSAGRAMVKHTDLSAGEIAKEALSIAADICVYTNHNIKVEELDA